MLAITACASLAFTGLSTTTAWADEKKPHAPEHGKVQIPGTTEEIMKEIHKHHGELAEVVKSKKLAEVHEHAFAIRDLAKGLIDKVPVDKKSRLQGSVNKISKLATDLDNSGDANDQAKTEANLKTLDGVLAQLDGQVK